MSTSPNRGASGGPCGGLEERKTEPNTVRPSRSDSSKSASSKPGAVLSGADNALACDLSAGAIVPAPATF